MLWTLSKKKLSAYLNTNIIEVGNPRLDRYFWESNDAEYFRGLYNLDKKKKTIVWMPTVSNASSVSEFIGIIEKINEKYNVLVNPHPLSTEDFDILLKSSLKNNIVKGNNIGLFSIADFIICDYGGAPFSAIYLDKNFILFNTKKSETCSILSLKSPEFYLRKYIPNFCNTEEDKILDILLNDSYWLEQKMIRKKLFNEFYIDERGTSSYKIAKILMKEISTD